VKQRPRQRLRPLKRLGIERPALKAKKGAMARAAHVGKEALAMLAEASVAAAAAANVVVSAVSARPLKPGSRVRVFVKASAANAVAVAAMSAVEIAQTPVRLRPNLICKRKPANHAMCEKVGVVSAASAQAVAGASAQIDKINAPTTLTA
jgi:hypothetical protein